MEWGDDPVSDKRPPAKRSKKECATHLKIQFPSTTCVSTSTAAQLRAIKTTQFEVFVKENVLGGLATEADPDIAGQVLRQFQGNLWHNVFAFWCLPEIQHVAGVLALCLDGYGHGHMRLLVRDKHAGCAGRWDMLAVWAAFVLKKFPPRFVSTLSLCPFICFLSLSHLQHAISVSWS